MSKNGVLELGLGTGEEARRLRQVEAEMEHIEREVRRRIRNGVNQVDSAARESRDFAGNVNVNPWAWWQGFAEEFGDTSKRVFVDPVVETWDAISHPVETLGALATGIATDPLGTLQKLGAGALNLETWKNDPGVAAAQLGVTILTGLLTGGGTLVATSLRGVARTSAVADRLAGEARVIRLESALSGKNRVLNNLEPSTTYVVDGRFEYKTDANSRVVFARTSIIEKVDPATASEGRNIYRQRIEGGADRLPGDEGSHLFAAMFGGPGESVNLVALRDVVNRGEYYAMEREWDAAISGNPPKTVDVSIDIVYPQDSQRPAMLKVTYDIDGARQPPRKFLN
ncbi:DNA/RNA non-specific endonuclease [Arthrobacter sp. CJ23]|uniref:DNA/RNA non-specific endonuclease n=1 Tax=Arthrobacter sp. CJ23 TaxID=2972479 RepID=UPI00215CD8C5|nr:DNA/RNA non-specific endonuclease [Arthrobacter sp. CJ23]UVJ38053.1 DNA/RNA non-specific endonuclease [Arthrobacter sp. CJ23]